MKTRELLSGVQKNRKLGSLTYTFLIFGRFYDFWVEKQHFLELTGWKNLSAVTQNLVKTGGGGFTPLAFRRGLKMEKFRFSLKMTTLGQRQTSGRS